MDPINERSPCATLHLVFAVVLLPVSCCFFCPMLTSPGMDLINERKLHTLILSSCPASLTALLTQLLPGMDPINER
jgi:hypothetical protein